MVPAGAASLRVNAVSSENPNLRPQSLIAPSGSIGLDGSLTWVAC